MYRAKRGAKGPCVSAADAPRYSNLYRCPECDKPVLLAAGEIRDPYFRHLEVNPDCSYSDDGPCATHHALQAQDRLRVFKALDDERWTLQKPQQPIHFAEYVCETPIGAELESPGERRLASRRLFFFHLGLGGGLQLLDREELHEGEEYAVVHDGLPAEFFGFGQSAGEMFPSVIGVRQKYALRFHLTKEVAHLPALRENGFQLADRPLLKWTRGAPPESCCAPGTDVLIAGSTGVSEQTVRVHVEATNRARVLSFAYVEERNRFVVECRVPSPAEEVFVALRGVGLTAVDDRDHEYGRRPPERHPETSDANELRFETSWRTSGGTVVWIRIIAPAPLREDSLSVTEAAERLGRDVSQVRRDIDAGRLRSFKLRGDLRLRPVDVDEFGRASGRRSQR